MAVLGYQSPPFIHHVGKVEQMMLCVTALVLLPALLLEPSELRFESGDSLRVSRQAFGERVAFLVHLTEPLLQTPRVLAHLAKAG
jgi:hypothetical protein